MLDMIHQTFNITPHPATLMHVGRSMTKIGVDYAGPPK